MVLIGQALAGSVNMAQFAWAYIDCESAKGSGSFGPPNSLQFVTESSNGATTGSAYLTYHTASMYGHPPSTLFLSGNLIVTGAISASTFHWQDITHIDATGSTFFGDDQTDSHVRSGSMYLHKNSNWPPVYRFDVVNARATMLSDISSSLKGMFKGAVITEGYLHVSGTSILGNESADNIVANAKLTASQGGYFADRVGIGTNSPGNPLDVQMNESGYLARFYALAGNQNAGILIRNGDRGYGFNVRHDLSETFVINEVIGETDIMAFDVNGKVGIGTNSPTHKLTVVGGVSGSGVLQAVGNATVVGTLNVSGAATMAHHVVPKVNDSKNLGSSDKKWSNIYCTTLYATTIAGGSPLHLSASSITLTGSVTFSGSGTVLSSTGSYYSGSGGSTEISGGHIIITGSSPAITIAAGDLIVSGSSYLGDAAADDTVITSRLTASQGMFVNADSLPIQIGASADLQFVHNGTNSIIANKTGHLLIDSQAIGKHIRLDLGADDATTAIHVRNNSGATKLSINAAGAVSGSSTLHAVGATTFGSTLSTTGSITAGSHILPFADNSYNLGSGARRWANLYTGDLHLKNDRGDWTIVEEEDFLCVINNKTGKKFKMNLIPLEDDE